MGCRRSVNAHQHQQPLFVEQILVGVGTGHQCPSPFQYPLGSAQQARRRSSAARRKGSADQDWLATASELATGGDIKNLEGLPAAVVALIALYERKFYW